MRVIFTALLWVLGFGFFAFGIGVSPYQAMQAGFIGMIIGMVLLQILVMRDEDTKQAYFGSDEEMLPVRGLMYSMIGCLTEGVPAALLISGIILTIIRLLVAGE
jgi:hypothetical protein